MATTTLHKLREFPSEIRLEIWDLFLDDEARGRRVVVWDGRVMPFAHLASPLLSVSVETRECALVFYLTKVNIYFLKKPMECLPWPGDPVREVVAEGQGVGDDAEQVLSETNIAETLTERARAAMEGLELISPAKGALYLNPERDTILHGHNCGVHFFARKRSELIQDGQGELMTLAPLWQAFSSKLPPSFYQAATYALRVVGLGCHTSPTKTKLSERLTLTHEEAQLAWKPFPIAMNTAHPILRLNESESDDLMHHISRSPKPLPGKFEAWGIEERDNAKQPKLASLISRIEEAQAQHDSILRAANRLDSLVDDMTTVDGYDHINKVIEHVKEQSVKIGKSIKNFEER